MEKQEFYDYLDELSRETGFDLDKVQKSFAWVAARHYHEQQVKNLNIPVVIKPKRTVCVCNGTGYYKDGDGKQQICHNCT